MVVSQKDSSLKLWNIDTGRVSITFQVASRLKSTQLSGTWTVVQEIASEEGYNHIYIYIDDKYILLVPTSGTSICFKFEIRSENRHSTYLTPSFYVTEMYLTTRMVT